VVKKDVITAIRLDVDKFVEKRILAFKKGSRGWLVWTKNSTFEIVGTIYSVRE
jgi:hypothetical protein